MSEETKLTAFFIFVIACAIGFTILFTLLIQGSNV